MSRDARPSRSLEAAYFDALYAKDSDPWRFATSAYEAEKYARTVASLPRARYASGLEIGCSIGVLTSFLAGRCDALLAIDVAEAALAKARERNKGRANVRFARARLPEERPEGAFDLIVLSEVLYYFDEGDLARVADAMQRIALPGADVILVHWLGPTPDYPLTGDEAAEAFLLRLAPAAEMLLQERRERYRLDLLRVRP